MIVAPGIAGKTEPIRPTAKSTIVKNHQNSSMGSVNRDSRFVNRKEPPGRDITNHVTDLLFDRVAADLIVNFPSLNSNRRIVYATCSWNKSARFHALDQDRRRPEAD